MKTTLLKNSGINENAAIKCGLACCGCLVKYFETFIRFLNSNAYIMIALTGQNFCSSAYDAFYLITRNIMKVFITHGCIIIHIFSYQSRVRSLVYWIVVYSGCNIIILLFIDYLIGLF